MKKYTRLFSISILCGILITMGFTSCLDDDDYSLDKYWVSMATVNKVSEGVYDFTLDDGSRLWIAAPVGLNLKPKYDRAIIDYTILSDKQGDYDHYIRLNSFYSILTKKPVYIPEDNEEKQDSIGFDPIKIHSIWTGGGYLNISFEYKAGGSNSHMLNLVSSAPDLSVGDDFVKLEFRHNNNGSPANYPVDGYVCFDLSPYMTEGRDKVIFEVSAKNYDGETKIYKVEYNYDDSESQPEKYIVKDSYDTTNLNIY